MTIPPRPRIFSGMRPTGPLHVGHLIGALRNWVRLQEDHVCFFGIVDWHMLTTHYQETAALEGNIVEMAATWLACGLDPARSTLLVQSQVKQHAELALLLGMVTPLGWLERLPTYKEQLRELAHRDIQTFGFLGYPVLQAADIAAYRATRVPVGEDQVPHLELAREIVRRFNFLYGQGCEVLPEPVEILSPTPRLLGVDGRKMSKSYDNAINLADAPETVRRKVSVMVTDPARVRRTDPGNPDVCSVFDYHRVFTDADRVAEIDQACRRAAIGCVDCKRLCADSLEALIGPVREGRAHWIARPREINQILAAGNERARTEAEQTLASVRAAVGLR